MTTTYIESQGMELQRGDGASPEVFTLIDQITTLDGPDGSASEIDITTLDSTAREFAMGLKDSGSITFEAVYDPAKTQHQGLRTDWNARTLRNFQLVFTNSPATTWSFSAYVQNFSISAGVDEVVRLSVTLRISGDVTVA
jgi:predicted secreted protein